ncbi:alpha/beta hydrolase family protein [Pseudoalteromonas rubra]|uniref:Platelet-activating factor acetylhydrolase plasma/intracellular n=1 Tax=Pseudoalteromonas rubra TaxID=43658 RepID=A0A5S3WX83_9GAMM|nr:hypothetical protein [Pseudoalteromonas rubra]TMP34367.1 hypothetical protein CWB98_18195 [Pseudoalteromonas rubra]
MPRLSICLLLGLFCLLTTQPLFAQFSIDHTENTLILPLAHPVGTHYMYFEDSNRHSHRTQPNAPRQLGVRFFYPTKLSASTRRLPLLNNQFSRSHRLIYDTDADMTHIAPLSAMTWNIAAENEIHLPHDALPLIIFSHGYYLNPELFTIMAAYIASRGYLVASINHSFGSDYYQPPNSKAIKTIELPSDDLGIDLPMWSADQRFVLTKIKQMNHDPQSPLFNTFNGQVGILGHSYGGAAAFYTAAKTPEVTAIVNMDGTVFGWQDITITQPFMYVQADEEYFSEIFINVHNKGYLALFESLNHVSFSDIVVLKDWLKSGLKETPQVNAILDVARLNAAFFEHHFHHTEETFVPAIKSATPFSLKLSDCNPKHNDSETPLRCLRHRIRHWTQQLF